MTHEEKEEWLILQAKLVDSYRRVDFLKSLKSEKLVMDMPDFEEIKFAVFSQGTSTTGLDAVCLYGE